MFANSLSLLNRTLIVIIMRIDYLMTNPQLLLLKNKIGVMAGSIREIIEHFFIPG
jgi:hypothetical protein